MTPKKIPQYNLRGEWFDMGRQLGQIVAEDIKNFNNRYFSSPFNIMRFGSWSHIEKYVRQIGEFLKDYSKTSYDFVSGIAEGSKLPFNDVLLQGILPELTHINSDRDWPAGACTGACVSADFSATQGALIGQCWDFNFELPPWYVAKLVPPLESPELMIVGAGSFFCCSGINSAGLGVTFTSSGHLPNVPPQVGVPASSLLLETLGTDDFNSAMDTLVAPEHAGAFNSLLTDGYTNKILIEVAGRRVDMLQEGPILTCGNHYQHPNMIRGTNQNLDPPEPPAQEFARSSEFRTRRLKEILQAEPGEKVSLEYLKICLKDHENHPLSVCAHEEGTILHFRTLGAMILEPAMRTVHFCPTAPCRGEFETFTL